MLVPKTFWGQPASQCIKSFTEKRNATDSWFQRMYAVSLSELVGGAEERPRVCSFFDKEIIKP